MNDYLAWHLATDKRYAARWESGQCTCGVCTCFPPNTFTDWDCPLHGTEADLTDSEDCGKVGS